MHLALGDYRNIVFDCDGVILDSNRIKSRAFHRVSMRFGADVAEQFVRHHQKHGGISRYRKFAYLLDEMVQVAPETRNVLLAELLDEYALLCVEGLRYCALIPGVKAFLDALPGHINAFVVTGGDQNEVRTVFAARGLDRYFRIVLGSPTSKHDNMQVLARRGVFGARSLYFGDAELDIRLAIEFGLDFVFVSGVSEWRAGREACAGRCIADFTELA